MVVVVVDLIIVVSKVVARLEVPGRPVVVVVVVFGLLVGRGNKLVAIVDPRSRFGSSEVAMIL